MKKEMNYKEIFRHISTGDDNSMLAYIMGILSMINISYDKKKILEGILLGIVRKITIKGEEIQLEHTLGKNGKQVPNTTMNDTIFKRNLAFMEALVILASNHFDYALTSKDFVTQKSYIEGNLYTYISVYYNIFKEAACEMTSHSNAKITTLSITKEIFAAVAENESRENIFRVFKEIYNE